MTAQTVADSQPNASGNAVHSVINSGTSDWQEDLRQAFRDPRDLLDFLALPHGLLCSKATQNFTFLVSKSFAQRMQSGDARDPLLLQVLPVAAELVEDTAYTADPLDEEAARKCDGVLQKYASRNLVVATPACAIHCRYCFRRHFEYQAPAQKWWQTALEHIEQSLDLEEVILSGGDPLMLNNQMLEKIILDLEQLTHITRLRIHTRLPIVLPSRIDKELQYILQRTSLQVVVVVHSNHAQEIDQSVVDACHLLRDCGALLLNQSVLLRDINDSANALADLSRALIRCAVMPYYIHALDHVAGVQHFSVPDEAAKNIMRQLQAQVSGYMLPRLVREIPGEAAKTIIPFNEY
ncbi:MAG: EF-P beta-lysylation protein EpmB [Planctomycetes bacterium]|nr:EF-P beta-lysylation protein EpmB [Planctomycetota bacterium]